MKRIRRPIPGTSYVFGTVDFEAGELITDAQSLIWITGYSKLADALNAMIKVHNALAATILGLSYDEFCRRYDAKDPICVAVRQAVKPANFGFPGRMGPYKLVLQQRKQGPDTPCAGGPSLIQNPNDPDDTTLIPGYRGLRFCILMDGARGCGINEDGSDCKVTTWYKRTIPPTCRRCIECATRLREGWLRQWPEHKEYFDWVQHVEENGQPLRPEDAKLLGSTPLRPGQMIQHISQRIRGGAEGNAIANGYFQGLLADAAKDALVIAQRECTDSSLGSVLCGSRVILFAHDELIAELREEVAHECAYRLSEIMVSQLRKYCPDLAGACFVEPALMCRWYKGAAKIVHGGRLVPWWPEHKKKTCPECKAV